MDSSTSACKVQLRDGETGEVVSTGRAAHSPTTPPRSEQHPEEWEEAFAAACGAGGIGAARRPSAIAVAAQQHGMVVLGPDGTVLRPAKLWNDTESAVDCDELLDELSGGAAGWAATVGSVPVPAFTVTKLRWLRRCEPATWDRVASILLPHDWLTFRLTGRRVTDRGDASGTGYWSPAENRYRVDVLDRVLGEREWLGLLPEVLDPRAVAGEWRGVGALVAPGTGDNMAAALALGLEPGDLALSLGTSGTAFVVSATPSSDPRGAVAGFADATGRFLPLVCTMNATKVTDAVMHLLGVDAPGFDHLALSASPGAAGMVLVPHFDGERTPNRPDATGTLVGLRSDLTPAQVARAAIEGVVCNLLEAAEGLPGAQSPRRVFLIGGAARSAAYRRVVADLTGQPVLVPFEQELVAAGAALQAAAVMDGIEFAALAAAWGLGRGEMIEPDERVDAGGIRLAYARAVQQAAQ
ncbi:MAG TPA: xylulokinase [Acidimicrobiales bacterium]|nr:xylulokinase [Acidimicrobiales bacterium]